MEIELIDKQILLIVNSKSTQTNTSDIAMIEENEDHLATISQCIQTEIP